MDSFIDRFAQRRNAQEMIRANYMAEAEEKEKMSAKIAGYEEILEEIRRSNLQNVENAEKVKEVLEESLKKIDEVQKDSSEEENSAEEMKELLEQQKIQLEELLGTQKTQMEELLASQKATGLEEAFMEQKTRLEELFKASDDFNHKESVKVYRNVQAVIEEELPKQTQEIKEAIEESVKNIRPAKGLMPIAVITLILTLGNLAILIMWSLISLGIL